MTQVVKPQETKVVRPQLTNVLEIRATAGIESALAEQMKRLPTDMLRTKELLEKMKESGLAEWRCFGLIACC